MFQVVYWPTVISFFLHSPIRLQMHVVFKLAAVRMLEYNIKNRNWTLLNNLSFQEIGFKHSIRVKSKSC